MKKLRNISAFSFTKCCLLLFALSLPAGILRAQVPFTPLRTIDSKASQVTIDKLGNIYTLEGSRLTCLDSTGKLKATFSNFSDGVYTSVDVNDPLKILLYSREFSRIRFLDQNLAQKSGEVDLSAQGYPNVLLACTSYESGFWIYDATGMQVVRFNSRGEQEQTSGNIAALAGFAPVPVFMTECDNMLYIADTAKGILIFDRYGAYLKTLPIYRVQNIHFFAGSIYVSNPDGIVQYNTGDPTTVGYAFPEKPAVDACLENGRLYLLNGTQLKIYKFTTFAPQNH
jgi:hypothetical protein